MSRDIQGCVFFFGGGVRRVLQGLMVVSRGRMVCTYNMQLVLLYMIVWYSSSTVVVVVVYYTCMLCTVHGPACGFVWLVLWVVRVC